jgi:hypothetical protein
MHLQICGGEDKGGNTHAHSPRLTGLGRAGPGGAWHGKAMGKGARRVHE